MELELEGNPTLSTPLFPPGRILYLAKTRDIPKCCWRDREYTPLLSTKDKFREAIISPTMVMDHLPDRYLFTLRKIVDEWG